jgi:hypothetical protein
MATLVAARFAGRTANAISLMRTIYWRNIYAIT